MTLATVLVAVATAAVTVGPRQIEIANAASAPEGPAAERERLRGERTRLLLEIAAATEAADMLRAAALARRAELDAAERRLRDARQDLTERAVAAYVDSSTRTLVGLRSPTSPYLAIVLRDDRVALQRYRATRQVRVQRAQTAAAAMEGAAAADVRVSTARRRLAATAVRIEALDVEVQRNEAARRAALDQVARRGLPTPGRRYLEATRRQNELMAAHPFGPAPARPPEVVPTQPDTTGVASWYGPGFDGRPTASGAIYDQEGWTVAHRTLPLGTVVWISRADAADDAGVLLLVNDRGPYIDGRTWDLSAAAARALGIGGLGRVRAQIVDWRPNAT